MKKQQVKSLLKLLLKVAFTTLALWIVYRKIDIEALPAIWAKTDPWLLLLALPVFAVSQAISSFRLLNFYRNIRLFLPIAYNIKLYLLGMFYSLFLPGGIGGDGYKILVLKRETDHTAKELFSAVFFDRLSGLWALCFILAVFSGFIPLFSGYTIWLLAAFAIGSLLYYWVIKRFFRSHHTRFFTTHLLAIAVQLCQLLCVTVILRAIGFDGNYFPYLAIFLLSSLATLFPFSIGGLGAREVAIVWGAATLALDKNLSVAVSLYFYFVTAIVSLSAVFLLFRPLVFPRNKQESGTSLTAE